MSGVGSLLLSRITGMALLSRAIWASVTTHACVYLYKLEEGGNPIRVLHGVHMEGKISTLHKGSSFNLFPSWLFSESVLTSVAVFVQLHGYQVLQCLIVMYI